MCTSINTVHIPRMYIYFILQQEQQLEFGAIYTATITEIR